MLRQFKYKISTIYRRKGVIEWLSSHLELINLETLGLIKFIEENESVNDFQSLNISRVCEIPEDLHVYNCFNELYLRSEKSDWIDNCLKNQPVQ